MSLILNPYIIAEIGSNFDQSFSKAKKLITAAKKSGASAVKFQLFSGAELYPDNDRMQKIFNNIELKKSWITKLRQFSRQKKIDFFLSVFDKKNLAFLESKNFKFYKVASSETTNIDLLKKLAKKKNTIFLSTGMCDLDDVTKAYKILKNTKLTIMQCHSVYPLKVNDVNINAIKLFKKKFKNCNFGFSDHTTSNIAAITAVGLGATVFEKHFTLNKKSKGPDHFYSYEPTEFASYVKDINDSFKSLGLTKKYLLKEEKKTGRREGIYLKNSIKKNTKIQRSLIYFKTPALGIRSKYANKMIGKRLKINKKKDSSLFIEDLK